jgi:hypothetical protein
MKYYQYILEDKSLNIPTISVNVINEKSLHLIPKKATFSGSMTNLNHIDISYHNDIGKVTTITKKHCNGIISIRHQIYMGKYLNYSKMFQINNQNEGITIRKEIFL